MHIIYVTVSDFFDLKGIEPVFLIIFNNIHMENKITPKKVVEILGRHGQVVTLEQAEKILKFILPLAKIAVEQALRKHEKELKL